MINAEIQCDIVLKSFVPRPKSSTPTVNGPMWYGEHKTTVTITYVKKIDI